MAFRTPLWKRPRAQLFALTGVVWALVLAILVIAWPVLLPFVLAALAAYVIDPLISRLARARVGGRAVPRWGAVVVVYVALGGFAYVAGVSILPQI